SWPGHFTIATGAYPKTHGITTNSFIVNNSSRQMVVLDREHQVLGSPASDNYSPENIRVTGISDWIRAADSEAQTVALSLARGLALAYFGKSDDDRTRNHVYWLDRYSGRFVTSTYYRDGYPEWLQHFNDQELPKYQESLIWSNSVPEEFWHLARRDDAPYESDGIDTTFPHTFEKKYAEPSEENVNAWFYSYSPHANEALFDLTKLSIENLKLGQRESTDLIALDINNTDGVAHYYGPQSLEQLDVLMRLDHLLGDFLAYLDQTVGREKYIVVLCADHGGPNIAEYELEQGRPAKRISEGEITSLLLDIERFIVEYSGPDEELAAQIADELEESDFVARAMTPEELMGSGPADRILGSYRNGYLREYQTAGPLWTTDVLSDNISPYHPSNYGIKVEFIENGQHYLAPSAHGSSHLYDQEIPIIFFGGGVKAGISSDYARTVDISPTLASLVGVSFPETVDGKVLKVDKSR
ncbi:alkaline phosphatase family protein, partial [Gemmatimonadota bacterium]